MLIVCGTVLSDTIYFSGVGHGIFQVDESHVKPRLITPGLQDGNMLWLPKSMLHVYPAFSFLMYPSYQ